MLFDMCTPKAHWTGKKRQLSRNSWIKVCTDLKMLSALCHSLTPFNINVVWWYLQDWLVSYHRCETIEIHHARARHTFVCTQQLLIFPSWQCYCQIEFGITEVKNDTIREREGNITKMSSPINGGIEPLTVIPHSPRFSSTIFPVSSLR